MLYAIESVIYVEAPDGADPEDIATQMALGLRDQLAGFPAAEVVKADVKLIRTVSDEEANEEGLTE